LDWFHGALLLPVGCLLRLKFYVGRLGAATRTDVSYYALLCVTRLCVTRFGAVMLALSIITVHKFVLENCIGTHNFEWFIDGSTIQVGPTFQVGSASRLGIPHLLQIGYLPVTGRVGFANPSSGRGLRLSYLPFLLVKLLPRFPAGTSLP